MRLSLGVGLGHRFSLLLLLHEDLIVQKLELSWVQFGFSQHWWWFFAEQCLSIIFIRRTGFVASFILLILRQFEVHTQTNSGARARISVVCLVACLQAGIRRWVWKGHHNGGPILMVWGLLDFGACVKRCQWRSGHSLLNHRWGSEGFWI